MKVSKITFLLILAVPFAFFACAGLESSELDVAEVQAVIEENVAKFSEALVNGDVETALTFYTDDAIVMAPNAPSMNGMEAIKAGFTQMMSAGEMTSFKLNLSEVRIMGDRACEIGTYSSAMMIPGMESEMTDTGKYVAIWKQTADGSWKMSIDMWNSSEMPDMSM